MSNDLLATIVNVSPVFLTVLTAAFSIGLTLYIVRRLRKYIADPWLDDEASPIEISANLLVPLEKPRIFDWTLGDDSEIVGFYPNSYDESE